MSLTHLQRCLALHHPNFLQTCTVFGFLRTLLSSTHHHVKCWAASLTALTVALSHCACVQSCGDDNIYDADWSMSLAAVI